MNIIHRGKLTQVEFTLAVGDLFDAETDAIVSSEQTDFILSGNPESISGQIRHRYGERVQQELDEATKGQILHAGTVIDTTGGDGFKRIFHAGFHDPSDWPGLPDGSAFGDYFEAIGSCVMQVLDAAKAQGLRSVAFPLIGCGVFGLDERMLLLQFLDAVETFDNRLNKGEPFNVWLVIRDRNQFDSIVGMLLALVLRNRSETTAIHIETTGVVILDRFAARLAQRSNEDWAKWQLCRFTEIALEVMCFGLCHSTNPPPTPESLFEEGMAATFGVVRGHALKFAAASSGKRTGWGTDFFGRVLKSESSARALEAVNAQRNNLAHGRRSLPIHEIRELVVISLQLNAWHNISKEDGELRLADWFPWVVELSGITGQWGLFERWQKHSIRYIVPATGEVFKVPRKSHHTR